MERDLNAESLLALVEKVGKPSAVLSKGQTEDVRRLVEICKCVTKSEFDRLAEIYTHRPCLYQYMSDGWSVRCNASHVQELDGRTVRRKGRLYTEFLLQRALVTWQDDDGALIRRMLFEEPLGLGEGKTAWNMFTAAT